MLFQANLPMPKPALQRRARRDAPPLDLRPEDPYPRILELGLRVITHQHGCVECRDGVRRSMPEDMVGTDGLTVVFWRAPDMSYNFHGWETWHDGMHGGRYREITSALAWVGTAKDIRAGKRDTF